MADNARDDDADALLAEAKRLDAMFSERLPQYSIEDQIQRFSGICAEHWSKKRNGGFNL